VCAIREVFKDRYLKQVSKVKFRSERIALLIDKVNSPTKRRIVPSSLKLLLPKVYGFGIVILVY
jgi:hypothetical protein